MNEPKRFREPGGDRVTTLLLDAGHADAPSKARIDRIMGGIAGAGVTLAAEAAAAVPAVLGAAPLAAKSVLPIALVLKWLGFGVLAGVAVSAGATQLGRREAAPEAALSPGERTVGVTEATTRDQTGAVTPQGSRSSVHEIESGSGHDFSERSPLVQPARPLPVPMAPDVPHAIASTTAAQAAASEAAPETAAPAADPNGSSESRALREEVAALGLAKAALNRGAPAVALEAVRAYRARFAGGRLGPEATYIEMEAELSSGNRQRAREIAERLATGSAPNAERARAILKGSEK